MRIALVSYEYAGSAVSGGIGTYIRNVAPMLRARGHDVEVFTNSPVAGAALSGAGEISVHPTGGSREEFPDRVVPIFASRHAVHPFDLVEGPEYGAEAAGISAAFPELPLVVRVHGPTFTIDESNANHVPWFVRARYYVGALRRGRVPNRPWRYVPTDDPERKLALTADEVMANSRATADRVGRVWGIDPQRLSAVPCVFNAPDELLALDPESCTSTVLFLGRLEVRKGVIELAKAIPRVLAQLPQVRFRFVGRILPHPMDRVPLDTHVRRIVKAHVSAVDIVGAVPYSEVPRYFEGADVCVFPSDWEASGLVCVEAMAAARGVVGSEAGGMAEIIEHGRTGLLVPPRDPKAIAEAILRLLLDPKQRIAMGRAAREKVSRTYASDRIGPLQEEAYRRAIARGQDRRQRAVPGRAREIAR